MTYETFLERIQVMVRQRMGDNVKVCLHTIFKNNDLKREALCIMEEGCNISPTIYLHSYYEEWKRGTSLEEILEWILLEYQTNRCGVYLDVTDLHDFEKVKRRITYKLINYERNRQMLQDVPYRRFYDLAVVYLLMIENDFIGSGTAVIHCRQLEAWNVSEEELYHLAVQNTERLLGSEIVPMRNMILDLIRRDVGSQMSDSLEWCECSEEQADDLAEQIMEGLVPDERIDMYIMSNRDKYLGAAVMLNTSCLENFVKAQGCGCFVIPSSIHEVILIPEREFVNAGVLKLLLRDINASEVDSPDYLSDQLYYFDRMRGLRTV